MAAAPSRMDVVPDYRRWPAHSRSGDLANCIRQPLSNLYPTGAVSGGEAAAAALGLQRLPGAQEARPRHLIAMTRHADAIVHMDPQNRRFLALTTTTFLARQPGG